jgi:thymidylate synthase
LNVKSSINPMEQQYLDLVQTIMSEGDWHENRTGIRTKSIPGAMMRFDLAKGDPIVTTKRLAFKPVTGELVGFLRGTRSAADFRALGCKIWDQNANENAQWLANPYRLGEDDLGPVYGAQWRGWPAYKMLDAGAEAQIADALSKGYCEVAHFGDNAGSGRKVLLYKAIDQLRLVLDTIVKDPGSRRILFHGWNWGQLDQMALPPCHLLYQFLTNPHTRELSMCVYIRSNDLGLGAPFNMAEGAALLHLVARLTGYTPRWFTYFIGDAHIYENHMDMLNEQLTRTPFAAPRLALSDRIPSFAQTGVYAPEWLEKVEPSDFSLQGYEHHPALTAPMAV